MALGFCGTLVAAATVVRNDAMEEVGAGAVADPLIAVEANRAAIINRLAREFGDAAVQAGVNAETFRGVLSSLRADQLLAAALVGSFAELTAIVTQPSSWRARRANGLWRWHAEPQSGRLCQVHQVVLPEFFCGLAGKLLSELLASASLRLFSTGRARIGSGLRDL